ncbi:MAG: HD domain-containing protein [Eubacteriales bacterium]|nr:HD domain-containing protein [Clostridiales bacterium]MDY5836894.1 HD domain-containing protein [Eubacteriales bacterium]
MRYLAVINLGSHEVSLSICQLRNRECPQLLEKVSRALAFGADTYSEGAISEEKIVELMDVLADFQLKLKEYPHIELVAVAESAIREAGNRLFILDLIQRQTGLQVDVLSNNDQVYYQLLALSHKLQDFDQLIAETTLAVELGAGSIQFTLYDQGRLLSTQNMKLGSLRIASVLEELREHASNFEDYVLEYISGDLAYYKSHENRVDQVKNLIINGGNLFYIRQLAGLSAGSKMVLSQENLQSALKTLTRKTGQALIREDHIPSEHVKLLLPTALIVGEVFRFTGLDRAYLPDTTMEEGIILAYAMREARYQVPHDFVADRLNLVRSISQHYKTDQAHCGQVEKLALQIFDETKKLHGLEAPDREMLQLAAILHNVGKYISISKDDRRSYDIVRSSEIPGMSNVDMEFLARLIYIHDLRDLQDMDKGFAHDRTRSLRLFKLAAILILANAMDISHRQKIAQVKVHIKKGRPRFSLYSSADITLELWNLEQAKAFFDQVFLTNSEFVARILPQS